LIAAGGSGRSTSVIPAVPAARSVTTIAFIRHLPYRGFARTTRTDVPQLDAFVHTKPDSRSGHAALASAELCGLLGAHVAQCWFHCGTSPAGHAAQRIGWELR